MWLFHTLLVLAILPLVALCAEDYYKLLGIERDANDRQIKKAYRTLSKKFHPDKNPGDESAHHKFVAIAEAYDALIDPETRSIYDKYGHEGLQQHKQGGGRPQHHHDPFDLFRSFFGGSSGHFHSGERRGPNMEVRVALPLRDFYNGVTTEFTIEKQAICDACEGTGSADGKVQKCGKCHGHGMVTQRRQLAPGMIQQMTIPCDECGGTGNKIVHKCPVCNGNRVIRQKDTHELHIERGMPRGVRLTYENEADESPDWVAGDLIVQAMETDPKLAPENADEVERTDGTFFRRRGRDLFWREVLGIREALLGDWTRNITHLDGHIVRLGRKRGEIVQPSQVEVVPGEGMPVWQRELADDSEIQFGSLYVEYVVVLPDQMEKAMEKDLWAVFEKWRKKRGVDLLKDSGRPASSLHDEL